jgi:hypothetical protein
MNGAKRNAYRILVGKAEGKRPLERPRCSLSTVYICNAMVWAGKAGRTSNIDFASLLRKKYLCSKHFLVSDYRTAERVHLN